jgi:GNAT superfamily N-acetyltransferase
VEIVIREAQAKDARAIAHVHVDSWRTTYEGIVSSEFLTSLSYEQRERLWNNALSSPATQSFIHVAETSDGEVVGFVSAGPERQGDDTYKGEIYALYLLHSHQRRGIGRLLFKASLGELHQRGITSLLIWVLAANPSRKFYEALGGMGGEQTDAFLFHPNTWGEIPQTKSSADVFHILNARRGLPAPMPRTQ